MKHNRRINPAKNKCIVVKHKNKHEQIFEKKRWFVAYLIICKNITFCADNKHNTNKQKQKLKTK